MEKEYDVFINYTTISTKELKIAEEIGDYLEAKGLRCFVAHRDIQPPQWWLYNIRNAIDKSRMMVTVHSVDSNSETLFDYDLQIDQASKNEILAANTGKDIETVARDTERDNWFTAEEAKEYGLIDAVITKH